MAKSGYPTGGARITCEAQIAAGRNSMYLQCGVTAAICIVAAIPTPVFQQCGTMRRSRSAAMSQT
jgi:hypothetical protein